MLAYLSEISDNNLLGAIMELWKTFIFANIIATLILSNNSSIIICRFSTTFESVDCDRT